jgi:hypothetical protein
MTVVKLPRYEIYTASCQSSNTDRGNATTGGSKTHGIELKVHIYPSCSRAHRRGGAVTGDRNRVDSAKINHDTIRNRRCGPRRVSSASDRERAFQAKARSLIDGADGQRDFGRGGGRKDTSRINVVVLDRPVRQDRGVIRCRRRVGELAAQLCFQ